jgi:archaetidylinositol phosphate synthase
VRRIQNSLLSRPERWLLTWLCERCPGWISPDHLTVLGFLGACIVFGAYWASTYSPQFLWVVIFGFLLHWLGDSLDGSLARYRKIERPRYGFFVDHAVDELGNFLILAGLGLSPFVRMDVAMFTIAAYLLLSIYVFLKNHVMSTFEISFIGLSPTELRVALCLMTLGMLGGIPKVTFIGQHFSLYDLFLLLAATIFIALFVQGAWVTAAKLKLEDH